MDAIGFARLEIMLCACESGYTTSTNAIANDSSMNCCLTNEAITTVNRYGVRVFWIGPADHETLVHQGLVPNYMGFKKLNCSAIGRTAKC